MSDHGIYRATNLTLSDGQQSRFGLTQRGALRIASEDASGNPQGQLTAGTDRSGTTSATANTSTTLAAANAARMGLVIQNISANPMGINEFGGTAAIGTPGTYTVPAGGSVRINTNRAVSVVSGTASQPYTATEF